MTKYIPVLILFFTFNLASKEDVTSTNLNLTQSKKILGDGCLDPSSSAELNIGNVRANILGGGDMWWDLTNAQYEVPKNGGVHSLFAGSLWIGGMDDQNNLKIAAMTYRQTGSDFFSGPLNADTESANYGMTSYEDCEEYNQHWVISKNDVEAYVTYMDCEMDPDCDTNSTFPEYEIPTTITNWPASHLGFDGTNEYLAPFEDLNGNGLYEPSQGEYPGYDLSADGNCIDNDYLFGDQSIWWVFNDA